MLVKLVKILMPAVGFLLSCAGKLLILALGKHRAKKLLYDLISDPDIMRRVQAAGPMAAQSLADAGNQLRRVDPESVQWEAFIRDYGVAPQPLEVAEYLAFVQESRALDDAAMQLPVCGSLLAFCLRHPELEPEWKAEFKDVFDKVNAVMAFADSTRPGWNDFYMVQWFILRTDDIVSELVQRAKLPGQAGGTCTWMLNSVAGQDSAFKDALERAGGFAFSPEPANRPLDPRLLPDLPGVGPDDWQRAAAQMGIAIGPGDPQTGVQRAAELESKYALLEGVRIRSVIVREDSGVTNIVIDTDRGLYGFSSPMIAVSGPGISPEVPCPTR